MVIFSRKISNLSAHFAQIQTMDARDTLKYTTGVDVVAELLDLHARQQLNLPWGEHVEIVNQANSR
jgi:hypothetical protein